MWRSGGTGRWSAARSPFVGGTTAKRQLRVRILTWGRLGNRRHSRQPWSGGGRKKSGEPAPQRPQVSWPVALRQVRAWLEPWIMLGRYWRGWSNQLPPPELQALLDWVWRGRGIYLYDST